MLSRDRVEDGDNSFGEDVQCFLEFGFGMIDQARKRKDIINLCSLIISVS